MAMLQGPAPPVWVDHCRCCLCCRYQGETGALCRCRDASGKAPVEILVCRRALAHGVIFERLRWASGPGYKLKKVTFVLVVVYTIANVWSRPTHADMVCDCPSLMGGTSYMMMN